jgi:hypothetical protein
MFRWYQEAQVCYVYLADVDFDPVIEQWKDHGWASRQDRVPKESSFVNSRWFTRGWTLQELLAPSDVRFYSRTFTPLGSKHELSLLLPHITGISRLALNPLPYFKPQGFSVATRMSWAAKRQTTRVEDVAYCLLGLFDINMPLIYGEGKNAFRRLQEEIVKSSDDQTLFAWGPVSREPVRIEEYLYTVDLPARLEIGAEALSSLFAESPLDFVNSKSIYPGTGAHQGRDYGMPPMMMAGGVRITLPVISKPDRSGTLSGLQLARKIRSEGTAAIAVLDCYYSDNDYVADPSSPSCLAVVLYPMSGWSNHYFSRAKNLVTVALTTHDTAELVKRRKVLYIK